MVRIKTSAGATLNMDNLSFAAIPDADDYTLTSKLFGAYGPDGLGTEFRGSGFKYKNDLPTDGKISSITYLQGTGNEIKIAGLSVSVKTVTGPIKSDSLKDDTAWFKKLLAGNDVITGAKQNDKLYGYAGDDVIKGGSGNDLIVGGLGKDKLYGGDSFDTFSFRSLADSTKSRPDVIVDFKLGDHIELAFDADTGTKGQQRFQFVDELSGHAGELISRMGKVMGDVNGDGKIDFQILTPGVQLSQFDFYL